MDTVKGRREKGKCLLPYEAMLLNLNAYKLGIDKALIIWEDSYNYYYAVVSSTGKLLKKKTSIPRGTHDYHIHYYNGYIYLWNFDKISRISIDSKGNIKGK